MTENKGILVVVEVKDGFPSPVAAELFGAAGIIASGLNESVNAVAIGLGARSMAYTLGKYGAAMVYASETIEFAAASVMTVMDMAIAQANPRFILMAETDLGRDLAPSLAAKLNTAAVTDAVSLRVENGQLIITRPVYGGNALADFTIETEPQIVTIRPKAFAPAAAIERKFANVFELPASDLPAGIRILERVAVQQQGPKIEEAKIVVGGGRGLGGPDGFTQLKQLADLLGGVVGASRPPCDQGWWPESAQIGVTGKIIAPDLYIAVGISGSSQHVSGVSGAKTIVAINKDAEANIFKTAAYGVTSDWKKVVPALVAKVKELTGK
jgi:electron transfer flavoprotein alpha subunit